jgi:hypothetical protein
MQEIKEYENQEQLFSGNRDADEDGDELGEGQRSGDGYHITRREVIRASKVRDDIVIAMWDEYIERQTREA